MYPLVSTVPGIICTAVCVFYCNFYPVPSVPQSVSFIVICTWYHLYRRMYPLLSTVPGTICTAGCTLYCQLYMVPSVPQAVPSIVNCTWSHLYRRLFPLVEVQSPPPYLHFYNNNVDRNITVSRYFYFYFIWPCLPKSWIFASYSNLTKIFVILGNTN